MKYTEQQLRTGAEKAFILDLIVNKFPIGIVSYVADSFDLWSVVTKILPSIKDEILSRDGKLTIRPDSGDPVDIICGLNTTYEDISKHFPKGEVLPEYFEEYLLEEVREDTPHGEHGDTEYEQTYIVNGELYKAKIHNISWNRYDKQYYFIEMWEKAKITVEKLEQAPEQKGVIELLWEIFGGTINEQGYKVLDSHIGCIYGDSITLDRQLEIYKRLEAKGFATTNIVLGIGSYTYQYNTRDTFGYAAKGAQFNVKVIGAHGSITKDYAIYKDPATDDGTKKSLKGFQSVHLDDNGEYFVKSDVSREEEAKGCLQLIYKNGDFINQTTLTEVRSKIDKLI